MNYRHAYHAGNFADVLKHAVLALVIEHLKQKAAPFRVIDTHAGAGLYALDGGPAAKTGEWRQGIARIFGPDATPLPAPVARHLGPYLGAVATENPPDRLTRYPGSPRIARAVLRPCDRLVVNELHPQDGAELARLFARDRQTKVLGLDGWTALKSLLPPKERRGAVLIDPPYEAPGELQRLAQGLRSAVDRFATGIYLLWYPIKDPKPIAAMHRALVADGHQKLLCAELMIRAARNPDVLNGSGLLVLNPPHRLDAALAELLPFLVERLAVARGAGHRLAWLAGERGAKALA
jgi:23S rRNA (adenine2030-N6)-methyltransferase